MKVAITSSEENLDAKLDQRFGRCSFFAIYDTESNETQFIENRAKDASEGAGPAAVGLVASLGVRKIVSGEFGAKIKTMLNDLGIQMVIVKEEKKIAEIEALLNH